MLDMRMRSTMYIHVHTCMCVCVFLFCVNVGDCKNATMNMEEKDDVDDPIIGLCISCMLLNAC